MAGTATVVPEIAFLSYLVIRLHKLPLHQSMAIVFSKSEVVPSSGLR